MRGQHHVATTFQYTDLVGKRSGHLTEVRLGDDVEHDLAWSSDVDRVWAERPGSAAQAEVGAMAPVTSPT